MSELQNYYDEFRRGYWAVDEAEDCLCHGHGWALSDVDTFHKCPIHYKGQPHPEDDRDDAEDVVWVAPVAIPEVELDVSEDEIPF